MENTQDNSLAEARFLVGEICRCSLHDFHSLHIGFCSRANSGDLFHDNRCLRYRRLGSERPQDHVRPLFYFKPLSSLPVFRLHVYPIPDSLLHLKVSPIQYIRHIRPNPWSRSSSHRRIQ